MSTNIFLAIRPDDPERAHVQNTPGVVASDLARGKGVDYYPIFVDPDTGVPSLGEKVTLKEGARRLVKRIEEVTLAAGGKELATADATFDDVVAEERKAAAEAERQAREEAREGE